MSGETRNWAYFKSNGIYVVYEVHPPGEGYIRLGPTPVWVLTHDFVLLAKFRG